MYKVFLVDDEVIIREGIRDNVKWENTDFIFAGSASDGEMAIPMIQKIKPDILITDIKMPFMDGLQLSKIVKKTIPDMKIIILSGHDEFNFAREALSIGVEEYLLKPVRSASLLEVLERTAKQIESEKNQKMSMENIKKQLEKYVPYARDKFLEELTMGMVSSAEVIENCEHFNIDILSEYYIAEIIEIESSGEDEENERQNDIAAFSRDIEEEASIDKDIIKFNKSYTESVLIIKGNDCELLRKKAYSIADRIKRKFEEHSSNKITVCIGNARERIKGITQSYKDAEVVKSYKYIYGKNRITGFDSLKIDLFGRKEIVNLRKVDIGSFMKCGTSSEIEKFTDSYISNINEAEISSPLYIHYVYIDIMLKACEYINELGGYGKKILPEASNVEKVLSEISYLDELREKIVMILKRVFEYRDNNAENKYGSIIIKAKEYINKCYSDADISLNTVASYVNVSPSHFSTIFSQETGENFIEYLTGVRIKKAMELLKSTKQKTADISYGVGYNDSHYFSFIFKKIVGMTPREYRNDNLEIKKQTFPQN